MILSKYTTCGELLALCLHITLIINWLIFSQGGIYWLQIMDWYCSTFSLMLLSLTECVVIGWIYGKSTKIRKLCCMTICILWLSTMRRRKILIAFYKFQITIILPFICFTFKLSNSTWQVLFLLTFIETLKIMKRDHVILFWHRIFVHFK